MNREVLTKAADTFASIADDIRRVASGELPADKAYEVLGAAMGRVQPAHFSLNAELGALGIAAHGDSK